MIIKNLPKEVTYQNISDWISNFEYWLHTLLQNTYFMNFRNVCIGNTFTLEFSPEIKKEKEGYITLQQAKDIILKRFHSIKNDEQLIQRIKQSKSLKELESLASWIAEVYEGEFGERNYRRTKDEVDAILDGVIDVSSPKKLYVLGEYSHPTKTIILYENVIRELCPAGNPLFEEVFIHELFHAYHYYTCKESNRGSYQQCDMHRRNDYSSEVVLESLAAFFEYYYCVHENITTDINDDWQHNSIGTYPYSGAKYFLPYLNYGFNSLFINVLSDSYHDLDQALRRLLNTNMDDFYLVKNHKELPNMTYPTGAGTTNAGPVSGMGPIISGSGTIFTPDREEIEMWLHVMKQGWFILRYADDHGILSSIGVGKPSRSDYWQEKVYDFTRPYHHLIIDYLKHHLYFLASVRNSRGRVTYRELKYILTLL